MSPTTGYADDRCFPAPRANEMTSVGPECRRWCLLSRAISRVDTNVIETSASDAPSARSTADAMSFTRPDASGVRTPSAETSTMMLMAGSPRLDLFRRCACAGCRSFSGRWLVRRRRRFRLRRSKLRRDPAARRRVVDSGVVHPRKYARELLLHHLELRQGDRRLSELPLVDALAHD